MSDSIPLGQRESQRLEFKGADALKDPEKIAREVVAMLNAEGGEVWVGLREEGGRAVAVESIPDTETVERQLLDYLVDTIEPPLSGNEVDVEPRDEGEGTVLRIVAAPDPTRRPYAFLRKGGRHFVIRIKDRIRPMTRDEVLSRRLDPPALESAEAKMREEKGAILERGGGFFWLRLQPVFKIEIELRKCRDLLIDPELSGNRRGGWSFANSDHSPVILPDKLVTAPEVRRRVEIRRDGGMVFEVPLEDLSLGRRGQEKEIWPLALLELPVSAFRQVKTIYDGKLRRGDPVLADLVILEVRGWILRGGAPGPVVALSPPHKYDTSDDLLWENPLRFDFAEIEASPDECAYRLVRRVYEAFDFGENAIPGWFNRQSRRLVLPE
jgi:hypothetical protein